VPRREGRDVAVGAEDAGRERRAGGKLRAVRDIEELLQAVDESDVGERAAAGRTADLAADQIDDAVAEQVVVMRRARQTLDDVEAGQRRGARSRHRWLVEEAAIDIDGHPDLVVLEVGPVEAGAAERAFGQAGAADHDVVAALADELVVLAAADEDVVAANGVEAQGI